MFLAHWCTLSVTQLIPMSTLNWSKVFSYTAHFHFVPFLSPFLMTALGLGFLLLRSKFDGFLCYSPFRVIRITEINLTLTQDDKFRIHITEVGTSEVLGRKDIPVQLLPQSTETKLVNTLPFTLKLFWEQVIWSLQYSWVVWLLYLTAICIALKNPVRNIQYQWKWIGQSFLFLSGFQSLSISYLLSFLELPYFAQTTWFHVSLSLL